MKRNFITTLLLAVCCLLTFSSFAQNYHMTTHTKKKDALTGLFPKIN